MAPWGVSVLRWNPLTETTNATTVTFRVTFSEDVQNLDLSDLAFTGDAGGYATASSLTPVTGSSVFDLAVNVPLYANGLLTLDLAPGATIDDLAGNPLAKRPHHNPYESYTINHTTTPIYVNDAWRDTTTGIPAPRNPISSLATTPLPTSPTRSPTWLGPAPSM